MQESHMQSIASKEFTESLWREPDAPVKMAEKIKKETTNIPTGMRTPTPEEVQSMRTYAQNYRKMKPKASSRQIRRATQRKFSVQLLPNIL